MSLASTTKRVELPGENSPSELADALQRWLEEAEEFKKVTRYENDGEIKIEAETAATLLTWGQKISIVIDEQGAEINVRSPDQWIDWGKSEKTAGEIYSVMNDNFVNSDQVAI